MIEAAWLFAAVELNGALISRGAQVQLTDQRCAVERGVIEGALAQARTPSRPSPDHHWTTNAEHCSFDAQDNLLRIRLPQQMLATQTLTLGEASSSLSVAFLHDANALLGSVHHAAQPPARAIPSLAIDMALGSGLWSTGAVYAHGPISAQALITAPRAGPTAQRATVDYFLEEGGHLRAGDFRTERGPEQRFGEFRGLLATNRAAPLRGDGQAEADLAVRSPSRVQFFDRNGIALYSSEILPPGNYRIQGFGASTVPGFLEARLVDINGVSQSIALPWSADRKLLSWQQAEWEVFVGEPRELSGQLRPPPLASGRLRYGIAQHVTVGLHAERLNKAHRYALEVNTRALPNVISTAAIGQTCAPLCETTWFAETRATFHRHMMASAGASSTQSMTEPGRQQTVQASLSGALHPRVSATIHLASSRSDQGQSQHVTTASGTVRLDHSTSLVLQLRRHLLTEDRPGWSGFIGLTLHFSPQQASVSSYLTARPDSNSGSTEFGTNLRATLGAGQLYGPMLSLAHSRDGAQRSDGFFRYASPLGDLSLRADSIERRLNWSAASRLWLTGEATTLTPPGEDNLVIQKLGAPNLKIWHSGRDTQTSDANGIAVFRKAPPWTDSIYTVDAKSIPFGAQLASTRVRLPLAQNRAYVVDYRGLWSETRAWRLPFSTEPDGVEPQQARDRFGKTVFITADGFVDLSSADQLPLVIERSTAPLVCTAPSQAKAPTVMAQEVILNCQPQSTL